MPLKFFKNWSKGFEVIPIFQFFWDYLENSPRNVSVPGDKKISTHDKKTFDEIFFDHPIFNNEGERDNLYFSTI